jgi:hypothetical protein
MDSMVWDGTTMWGGSTRNFFRYSGSGASWSIFRADSVLARYGFTGGNGANHMKGLAVTAAGDIYCGGIVIQDRRGPGLIHYDGVTMQNVFPNTPGANDVIRLSQDTDGAMWASFRNFYVGKLMPSGTWVNYNSAIPGIQLPTNQSTNLTTFADSGGLKWFCTLSTPASPKPLDRLDDQHDANYANDVWTRNAILSGGGDGLGSLNLQRAVEDPVGNRWFLSDALYSASGWWGIQILSKDQGAWFQMTPAKDPRMLAGNVTDAVFGSDFAYVALREVGVQRWILQGYDWATLTDTSNDIWTTPVSRGNGLPATAEVNALALRSDGVLWIATSSGLYRYQFGTTTRQIPVYRGTGPGIFNDQVRDVALDTEENLWVATDLGLNRIAKNDEADIDAYTTAAGFIALSGLRYPLDIISPLAHANCQVLAMDKARNTLYVGTFGGLSAVQLSQTSATSDLSSVYVYPNPVDGRRGNDSLKIQNITGPVTVEIYDLEGQLVHSQTVDAAGEEIWDLKTASGLVASSGTYLVRIIGNGTAVTKSVSLLR